MLNILSYMTYEAFVRFWFFSFWSKDDLCSEQVKGFNISYICIF